MFKPNIFIRPLIIFLIIFLIVPWPALAAEEESSSSETQAENAVDVQENQAQTDQASDQQSTQAANETIPQEQKQEQDRDVSEENVQGEKGTQPDVARDDTPPPLPPKIWEQKQLSLKADDVSGAAVFNFPFSLPPGRNGLAPDLSLIYNSQKKNNDNLAGYGWEIPMASIVRSTKRGVNNLYVENDFSLEMGGQANELSPVALIDGTHGDYGFKLENSDNFLKLEFNSSDSWIVKDKRGAQYVFGTNTQTRQDDPINNSRIYRWFLEKIEDTNGSKIAFEYFKNEGQVYPKRIRYTGYDSDPGIFMVEFEPFASGNLAVRPDIFSSYTSGFKVKNNYRLEQVIVKANGSWVKKYEFQYTSGANGNRSLLSQIIESGRASSGETITLPAVVFHYQNGNNQIPDLLSQIINQQTGSTSSVTYQPSTSLRDAQDQLLNPKLHFLIQVVDQITTNDGFNNLQAVSYQYHNAFYYLDSQDVLDNRYAGFGLVASTDPTGNVTKTYYHQGNETNTDLGEYQDHISKRSRPYRVEQYDNNGNLQTVSVNKWDRVDLGNNRNFVRLNSTVEMTCDGVGSTCTSKRGTVKSKAVEYAYDSYGNVITQTNLGEVSASENGTYTDVSPGGVSDKTVNSTTYALNTTKWIVSLPDLVEIKDANNATVQKSDYQYDNIAKEDRSVPTKGNLTRADVLISQSKGDVNSTLKYEYNNQYGLPDKAYDPKNNLTTYSYSGTTSNMYPDYATNAKSQTTYYSYDLAAGHVILETDPNGIKTQKILDALGRVKEVKRSSLTDKNTLVKVQEIIYVDAFPKSATARNYLDDAKYSEAIEYYDGFERVIQKRNKIGDNLYSVVSYQYDPRGNLQYESLPREESGSARTAPDWNSLVKKTYTYDALNRMLAETYTLDGTAYTTNFAYDGWNVEITDPAGTKKKLYHDALGNLTRVDEYNNDNNNIYSTYYQYTPNNLLKKITDAYGNIREFTYDKQGKRTWMSDLHSTGDTTYGQWNFTYDASGNLTRVVDPKNQTINYTYDEINRMLTEDYTGQSGTEATYTYDTAVNGLGKIANVQNSAITTSYAYDNQGNVSSESALISGTTYATSYTYDRQGNISEITYPDSFMSKQEYDNYGLLDKVYKKQPGASYEQIISQIDYNPAGQISRKHYLNGAVEESVYDPAKLYRLTQKKTVKSGTNYQLLNYTYDALGNITNLADSSSTQTAKTAAYAYDDLSRLTSAVITNAASGPNYTHSYIYDALGNIDYKVIDGITRDYQYQNTDYANPHAVTNHAGQPYPYDRNGNLLSDGANTYTYDYQNRLAQSVKGSATTAYAYNHQRQRIKKETQAEHDFAIYPNQYYEVRQDDYTKKVQHYVFIAGERLGVGENTETLDLDLDGDGYPKSQDCDDGVYAYNPGVTWYYDGDLDYYYASANACQPGSGPSSYWYANSHNLGTDCDDSRSNVNPGRTEVPYDGLDNDCNSATRDNDLDQDNYNYPSDCNDNSSSIYPGALEICGDGVDQDCNGSDLSCNEVDNDGDGYNETQGDCDDADPSERPGVTWYLDADNDNYYMSTSSCQRGGGSPADWYANSHNLGVDCNDGNSSVNPGRTEIPYNGTDDDCNSATRDDDLDQDSYALSLDCNDNNATIYPGAPEACGDGLDQDCSGVDLSCDAVDNDNDGYNEIQGDCDDQDPSEHPGLTWYLDADNDNYYGQSQTCGRGAGDPLFWHVDSHNAGPDCDDNNPVVNPNASETTYNGLDDDCDVGTLDDDLDQDGYALANDCDDSDPLRNPGLAEIAYNGYDDDCNSGTLDDDLDGDGFNFSSDCNDSSGTIYPDATEICGDGVDQDCSGEDLICEPENTVYEDAEDSAIAGWDIYDNIPSGAVVSNVYDETKQSRVVAFTGAGWDNGYRLRNPDGSNWNNQNQFVIQWSMKYNGNYSVYVGVNTTKGYRYISYTPSTTDLLYVNNTNVIEHGLGPTSRNNTWQTFTRDLTTDFKDAEPNHSIISIDSFWIRSNGRVDDIRLLASVPVELDTDNDGLTDYLEITAYQTKPYKADTDNDGLNDGQEMAYWGDNWNMDPDQDGLVNLKDLDSDNDTYPDGAEVNQGFDPGDPESRPGFTLYEDAADQTILGWLVYDTIPAGAVVSNVYDNEKQSQVIQFTGSGWDNAYRLYKENNTAWNNTTQRVIQWSMKYGERFTVYIEVETTGGHKYLDYSPVNENYLGSEGPNYAHHGLGASAKNNTWQTFTRDLTIDLHDVYPALNITAVNGFFIRGNGRVDEIKLMNSLPPVRSALYSEPETVVYEQTGAPEQPVKTVCPLEKLSACGCPASVTEQNLESLVKAIRTDLVVLEDRSKTITQGDFLCPIDNLIPDIYAKLIELYHQQGEKETEIAGVKMATTTTSNFYYYHNDHLSGTTVVTDEQGNLVEVKDYYPYGESRVEQQVGGNHLASYGFTGKEQDTQTGLQYFGARYYSPFVGRFAQIDPLFLGIGDSFEVKKITKKELKELLEDPQALNSYAYTRNNPLIYVDENGEFYGVFGEDMAKGQRIIGNFLHRAADNVKQEGGIIGNASAFVTDSLGDIAGNVADIYDPEQKLGKRGIALGLVGLDVGTMGKGSKMKAGVKAGGDLAEQGLIHSTKLKSVLNINGRLINKLDDISGFREHGLDQIITRGVKPEYIKDAVENTTRYESRIDKLGRESFRYVGEKAVVVFNQAKQIISAWLKNN